MSRLVSVNVGLPNDVPWQGRVVRTAIWKLPVEGRRMVRRLNIEGDDQADRQGHGGEHRAVFVYQLEAYRYWQAQLDRDDFVMGQFGENFTVDGLADDEVCIGDRYRIGSALFEVTQPRVTCYRLGIRMAEPRMPALVVAHHRPGFYLRVLEEGEVGAGDDITLVARGPESMTVADIDALLYLPDHPETALGRAVRIPALSGGWRSSFQALLDQSRSGTGSGNVGLGPTVPAPAWQGFRRLRIAAVHSDSSSVHSIVLESADGGPLAHALPGQFVTVRLPATAAEARTVLRSYSLSGPPDADQYRISVKLEPKGVASAYLHTRARVGDVLDVAAPRGSLVIASVQPERPLVLMSAGVGITPVLAMLYSLAAEASVREVWWLYGARNSLEHPFADEVRTLLGRLPNAHSCVCYSQPAPNDGPGRDFDRVGRLTPELLDALQVPAGAEFYLCGPPAFLRDHARALQERQIPAQRIHTEVFGPEQSITPGIGAEQPRQPHQPSGPVGTGPTVSFARSGLTTWWSPRFGNLLVLAEACAVPARWSCRTGVCHTCESRLLDGRVSYAPEPLDSPGEGNLLVCCAEPIGDVVLDM
jgi:ferredoxin-NADP reductase/MOSC domain-containing protein YiiM/ferredoxin